LKVIIYKVERVNFDTSTSTKLSMIDVEKLISFETWVNDKALASCGYDAKMLSDIKNGGIQLLEAVFETGVNNANKLVSRLTDLTAV